ncbi:MAG: hypothetical protein DIZ80_11685 [endosymbiont of Galathealinum brachiosum]|uniref:Uncharacterized protein n=1 Tax=endosymbiont of Galathealinum brachiosum TaxID=2200906 RepID=A0A370DDG0_9GAMM|nr:MAG: hypothetical protein DIZ80_11685 [endosymbiont of Galathealinum brachiosum]
MKFSNEIINAYADGELQGGEKIEFEKVLHNDDELQQELDDLYALKAQLHNAYKNVELPVRQQYASGRARYAMYAALLLLTFSGGWFSGEMINNSSIAKIESFDPAMKVITEQPGKYILHISVHDKNKFKQTLDQAEMLMASYKNKGQNIELEILANSGGLDLFREDATPYTHRVKQLSKDYPNIRFIACSNAIQNLREKGLEPKLINTVHQGSTAIDQVVKRVHQGWSYIKI